ncbi:MAG: hypothetical protein CFE24_08665 [Flavobacterium sp. BFFFF2]|nr:MAG: hypothetical protein CFE24_08665 [Flavobacterium sp. BFFFF2]
MDMTTQMKKNLISRIKDSTDLTFLNALQTIFDATEKELFQLSREQQNAIETSRKQIIEGDFRKNEEVLSDMKTWLKKQ